MKRYVIIASFLLVILVALGGGYLALPTISGWILRSELADRGFSGAKLDVATIALTHIDIRDFDLGPDTGVSAKQVVVSYSPGRLIAGTIDGVELTSPRLPLAIGVSGLDLGALNRFLAEDGDNSEGGGVTALGPIKLSNGALQILTPLGEVGASLDGSLLLTDGLGTNADFTFSLTHPEASVNGSLYGILDDAQQLQIKLDIKNATSAAHVAFSELVGAVRIEGTLPNALTGGASLVLNDVRIGDAALGNMDVSGNVNGAAVNADLILGGGETGVLVALHAESDNVFDPAAPLRLSGEMATDGLSGPLAMPVDVVGALNFDIQGPRGDLQSLPQQLSNGTARSKGNVSGWVDAQHLSFNLADKGIGGSLNGRMNILVGPGGWQIKPTAGVNFDLAVPVANSIRRIEATLDALAETPFVAGGPSVADPLRLGMLFDGVVDDGLPFSGDLGGTLWPATTAGFTIEDMVARFDPWRMRVGRMDIDMRSVSLRLSGNANDLALRVASEARFAGEPSPGIDVSGGHISLVNRVTYDADGIRLFADECIELRVSELKVAGGVLNPGPQRICELANSKPVVHAVMGEGHLKRIDLNAVVAASEMSLQGVGPYPLVGLIPRIKTEASFDTKRSTWWSRLVTTGGNIKLEGPDVSLSAMDATIDVEGRESLLGARIDLRKASLGDQSRPLRFQPLGLVGKAGYQPGRMTFDGTLALADGPEAKVSVRHRPEDKRGRLIVNVADWTFDKDKPSPQAMLPILKGIIADVEGRIGADARIDWTPSRTSSGAEIRLQDLSFATQPAEVSRLSGKITLSDLLNLKTDGEQKLSVALIDAGLPLSNGEIGFELPGDRSARIIKAEWPLSGGRLLLEDVYIPFDGSMESVNARLSGLSAADMARQVDIQGFEAEGTLVGNIPVRLGPDGPVINNARIHAENGGYLRLTSPAAVASLKQSGEMAELLAKALADFRYTDLQVSLNGPLSGDITANAALKGANPALYDGKRIELNVSLQGALRDLLQSASVVNDLPGNIRDRVQGPSGKP